MKTSKLAIRFFQSILLLSAAFTSISAILAGWDAAVSIVGEFAGAAFVIAAEIIIYFGWLYVSTETRKSDEVLLTKIGAMVLAVVFAGVSVVTVHQSNIVKIEKSEKLDVKLATNLSAEKERIKMDSLRIALDKLKEIDPKKSPVQYKNASDLVDKLTDEPKETINENSDKPDIKESTNDRFSWIVAVIFQIFTPSLLMLSGLFGRRLNDVVEQKTNEVNEPSIIYDNSLVPTTVTSSSVALSPCDLLIPESQEMTVILSYNAGSMCEADIDVTMKECKALESTISYAGLSADGCGLTLPLSIQLATDDSRRSSDTHATSSTLTVGEVLPTINLETVVNERTDTDLERSSNLIVSKFDNLLNSIMSKSLEQPQTGFTKKYFVNFGLSLKETNLLISELVKKKVLIYSDKGLLVYS